MSTWYREHRWFSWGLCGAACAALIVHSLAYNFITDDAYISFVYARNLAEHGSLTFNLGEPVEGYTNFLWTVSLGALMWAGIPPEISSLVLAGGFAVGTLVISVRLCRHLIGESTAIETLPAWLLACSACFACWTSGGLETQMFVFWILAAIDSYTRADREARLQPRTGVFVALASLTRPEGLLVGATLGLHRLLVSAVRDRRLRPHGYEWSALGWFLALWLPYFAWRWWYYGFPFPNTYYVKAAGETTAGYRDALTASGWHYVWRFAVQSGAVFAAPLALMGLAVRPRSGRFVFASFVLVLVLVYLAYTVRVGGDFMGLYRFVLVLLPGLAVLVVVGLVRVSELLPVGGALFRGGGALVLLAVFALPQIALTKEQTRKGNWKSDNGIDTPSFLAVFAADRARIGRHMRDCFEPGDFSIVGGAGAQPYYGRMRAIDVYGLVSKDIAHNVAPLNPRPGHNKWGPKELLAKHKPTFVFSCYSIHRKNESPRVNCGATSMRFWYRQGYELVTMHVPGLEQKGEYYTFLKRKDRVLQCEGLVER